MTFLQFLLALGILTGAGISDLLGQSFVLFLNQVPWRRFLLCLAAGLLVFVWAAALWALGLFLLGWMFGLGLSLARCWWLVALAHSPLLLGVLVLFPHFGSYLFHALRAWVFLDLVVAVGVATQASLPVVVVCCLPGWLVHFSLTHLKLLRLERVQSWLWRTLVR